MLHKAFKSPVYMHDGKWLGTVYWISSMRSFTYIYTPSKSFPMLLKTRNLHSWHYEDYLLLKTPQSQFVHKYKSEFAKTLWKMLTKVSSFNQWTKKKNRDIPVNGNHLLPPFNAYPQQIKISSIIQDLMWLERILIMSCEEMIYTASIAFMFNTKGNFSN